MSKRKKEKEREREKKRERKKKEEAKKRRRESLTAPLISEEIISRSLNQPATSVQRRCEKTDCLRENNDTHRSL